MPADFTSTRTFGDATVSLISDGSGRSVIVKSLEVPESLWRPAVPEADADGEITVGYNVALVRIGDAWVLIDLGFDDPGPDSPWREPRHHRSPGVEAGLRELGVAPEDVTHVLITHNHGDHVAGAAVDGRPRFPRARHVVNRLDAASPHLDAVARAGLVEPVDGDSELLPGLTLVHAPGESAGHSIVQLVSRGQLFFFLGDLFHHPCEVEHLDWVSRGRDAAAMEASRRQLIAEAVPSKAALVFSHRPWPAWGSIVAAGDGFRWIDD